MKKTILPLNAPGILTQEDQHILQEAQQQLERILPMKDAIQIKAAEYWLKLGEADQALRELEQLPMRTWNHSKAMKTRIAAIGALRVQNHITIQEQGG